MKESRCAPLQQIGRQSERIIPADILAQAQLAFGSEALARVWLNAPNKCFRGASPFDHIATNVGTQEVLLILNAISTGGAA